MPRLGGQESFIPIPVLRTWQRRFCAGNGADSSGARKTAAGSPQGERGGAHQCHRQSPLGKLRALPLRP